MPLQIKGWNLALQVFKKEIWRIVAQKVIGATFLTLI
jgi:hypothetical protein